MDRAGRGGRDVDSRLSGSTWRPSSGPFDDDDGPGSGRGGGAGRDVPGPTPNSLNGSFRGGGYGRVPDRSQGHYGNVPGPAPNSLGGGYGGYNPTPNSHAGVGAGAGDGHEAGTGPGAGLRASAGGSYRRGTAPGAVMGFGFGYGPTPNSFNAAGYGPTPNSLTGRYSGTGTGSGDDGGTGTGARGYGYSRDQNHRNYDNGGDDEGDVDPTPNSLNDPRSRAVRFGRGAEYKAPNSLQNSLEGGTAADDRSGGGPARQNSLSNSLEGGYEMSEGGGGGFRDRRGENLRGSPERVDRSGDRRGERRRGGGDRDDARGANATAYHDHQDDDASERTPLERWELRRERRKAERRRQGREEVDEAAEEEEEKGRYRALSPERPVVSVARDRAVRWSPREEDDDDQFYDRDDHEDQDDYEKGHASRGYMEHDDLGPARDRRRGGKADSRRPDDGERRARASHGRRGRPDPDGRRPSSLGPGESSPLFSYEEDEDDDEDVEQSPLSIEDPFEDSDRKSERDAYAGGGRSGGGSAYAEDLRSFAEGVVAGSVGTGTLSEETEMPMKPPSKDGMSGRPGQYSGRRSRFSSGNAGVGGPPPKEGGMNKKLYALLMILFLACVVAASAGIYFIGNSQKQQVQQDWYDDYGEEDEEDDDVAGGEDGIDTGVGDGGIGSGYENGNGNDADDSIETGQEISDIDAGSGSRGGDVANGGGTPAPAAEPAAPASLSGTAGTAPAATDGPPPPVATESTPAPSPHVPTERERTITMYLSALSRGASDVEGTPQHAAREWIARRDELRLELLLDPSDGGGDDDAGVLAEEVATRFDQRYALATLHYALGIGAGGILKGWLGREECGGTSGNDWDGVGCDEEGWVRVLALDGANLHGTIPHELSLLTSMENLIVKNNPGLVGTIPHVIGGKMVQLRQLGLYGNSLTGNVAMISFSSFPQQHWAHCQLNTATGTIPKNLFRLSHLVYLNLADNTLMGKVHWDEIGQRQRKLQRLILHNNFLDGTVDFHLFAEVRSLSLLALSNNNFGGTIGDAVQSLMGLEYLYLDGNKLEGSIPDGIERLAALKSLNLDDNELYGTLPSTIGGMTSLEHFSAKGNALSGGLPAGLRLLGNLQTLNLASNALSGGLRHLSTATRLRNVHLYRNSLSGPLPDAIFSDLPDLEVLFLSSNSLTGTIPSFVGDARRRLRALYLSDNKIKGTVPEEICELHSLEDLFFDDNSLSGMLPECLGALSGLRRLYAFRNGLSGTVPSGLLKFPRLTDLGIEDNDLRGLGGITTEDGGGLCAAILERGTSIWADCAELAGGCECCEKCCSDQGGGGCR
ncbi:hypothetical protein ACHAWF_013302 [Thalassiosira exigua]